MTPRGVRKLETPEAFALEVECGVFSVFADEKRPNYVVLRRWKPAPRKGEKGQWERRAVGHIELRDARGAVLETARVIVRDAATKWYVELTGEQAAPASVEEAKPFTIGEAWAAISNPDFGKYPHATPFRDELENALEFASTVWGGTTPWVAIDANFWTKLIRQRVRALVKRNKVGIRATEITISRLITVAHWLRSRGHVAVLIVPPDDWHDALISYWKGLTQTTEEPEPASHRFTLDESRKLLHAAWNVDPRYGLLMWLGAELRLGMVKRCKRSHLKLDEGEFGQLTVPSSSPTKRGEVVVFTRGQRAWVDRCLERGYLRTLEAEHRAGRLAEYHLFGGGKLRDKVAGDPILAVEIGKPLSRAAMWRCWQAVEVLAGIDHVEGRGAYGVRRAAVDVAEEEHLSEAGLQSLGGWSTPDIPRRIYRDRANKAGRADAKKLRAHIRQEGDD